MGKVRATRHNGRKGKDGVFKAGHNDRTFNVENADHIDASRSFMNVYWDCYQGFNITDANGVRPERKFNFEQIEHAYYAEHFGDSIDAQNDRHIKSRHKERIRSVDDILKDPKTCPEETVYQLGTKDGHEDPALFAKVVAELIEEIQKRYGSNFKILNWALHMDEGTPHIHERHVFFADDGHGMNFPKQEKACEALGFELPNPDKKSSKRNNRKMSFDAEVRGLYIEIAEKYGVTIEKVPLEGKVHMEKNDYIIAKQNEEIAEKKAELEELTLKISDIDAIANEVADKAYEKACEVVAETVKETTIKADVANIKNYENEILKPSSGATREQRNIAKVILDGAVSLLKRKSESIMAVVRDALNNPAIKKKNHEDIAEVARMSVRERLAQARMQADIKNASRDYNQKKHERGER